MSVGQVFYLVNSRFLLDSCFSFRALAGNKWIPIFAQPSGRYRQMPQAGVSGRTLKKVT
jgi:hypothetical protein